jgi:putative ABC transport system permease protein
LIVAETALSLLLLIAAGLLMRSFSELHRIDPGMRTDRLLTMGTTLVLGVPLRRGRTFTEHDGVGFEAKTPRLGTIVISEAMAKAVFPNEDPIGKRVFFDFEVQRERNEGFPAPRYEIVGVVGDVRATLDRSVQPTMYRPILDIGNSNVTLLLHTAVEPHTLIASVRAALRELDAGIATFRPLTIEEQIANSTGDRRFTLLLLAMFAGVAVLLAVVGLYGGVSYSVSQRRHEIGVRLALGATRATVSKLVVMQGLKPAIAGAAIGLTVAAFATRILRTMLFSVTPTDPLTFLVIPVILIAVATVACYLPAVRAARHDPMAALRAE